MDFRSLGHPSSVHNSGMERAVDVKHTGPPAGPALPQTVGGHEDQAAQTRLTLAASRPLCKQPAARLRAAPGPPDSAVRDAHGEPLSADVKRDRSEREAVCRLRKVCSPGSCFLAEADSEHTQAGEDVGGCWIHSCIPP